jgi:hypothetical protein
MRQTLEAGRSALASLEGAREQSWIRELGCESCESLGRSAPAQLLDICEQPLVGPQGREGLEQQGELVTLPENLAWKAFNGAETAEQPGC